MDASRSVVVLCGGVGAARFLAGLMRAIDPGSITAIVNTGDDMVLHGLSISPDLDTCVYTLADAINPETGWGLAGETWQARTTLERYGGETWFGLGDRDLGTHLYRSQRLAEGASLTTVTREIAAAWELDLTILPMTDDPVRTRVTNREGEVLDFQRWFVERAHADPIVAIDFVNADHATPSPAAMHAIETADVIVIAPSNPFVSIAPIRALPGVDELLVSRRETIVGISPIIGGAAVKGPAAQLMTTLGHEVSAVGVAAHYSPIMSALVIDQVDAELAGRVAESGVRPVVADTIMRDPEVTKALAQTTMQAITKPSRNS